MTIAAASDDMVGLAAGSSVLETRRARRDEVNQSSRPDLELWAVMAAAQFFST
jgi:hypothetical protein